MDLAATNKSDLKAEGEEVSKKDRTESLIASPPSFYDRDMEKWKQKFQKHIKEREIFKRNYQKTMEMTCFTRNTNVRKTENDEQEPVAQSKRGKSIDPKKGEKEKPGSLFNKVMKRRKSRQSNYAPGVVDFDYAGDTSKFEHLINSRKDLGLPNSSQLNFEIKLRNYKNGTDFTTSKPWVFPPVKKFSPKQQWDQVKKD